jgi:RNA polymerase sigma-70 factor (ECF subfamily)
VRRRRSSITRTAKRDEYYAALAGEFGAAIDRLAAGYEADPDKRRDLRQDIHFQLWKSLEYFDERCSLKTWTFRVAHNTAASYVIRERRMKQRFVGLDEIEETANDRDSAPDIDRRRMLQQLSRLILMLKPLDRQIVISYLEGMDAASIAEITGLSASNVAMKVHRIKRILSQHFLEEQQHVRC